MASRLDCLITILPVAPAEPARALELSRTALGTNQVLPPLLQKGMVRLAHWY
jgi:hypothetical protein